MLNRKKISFKQHEKIKMYRLFGIFAILTLLCISSTSGHDINYQFTSISVAEGLSQSTAQSILLDKKGKLWIGTKNGLNS